MTSVVMVYEKLREVLINGERFRRIRSQETKMYQMKQYTFHEYEEIETET